MKRGFPCLLIIASILLFASCIHLAKENEGVIIYDIVYLDEERATNPVIDLMPAEMQQVFKGKNSKSMIAGFMGMFLTAYISNADDSTNSLIFKLMTDRHYTQTPMGAPSLGFDTVEGLKIEKTGETADILGMLAHKAYVESDDTTFTAFDIYYTEDLDIANPNWNNPYRDINGVLLSFRVRMKGITMIIKARELVRKEIDMAEFTVPSGYKEVTPDEMNQIVENIMNSAQ
jgi:hypothetical protein